MLLNPSMQHVMDVEVLTVSWHTISLPFVIVMWPHFARQHVQRSIMELSLGGLQDDLLFRPLERKSRQHSKELLALGSFGTKEVVVDS